MNYNPSAQIKKQTSRCLRQLSGSLTETNIKKKRRNKQGKSDKDADKRDQPQAPQACAASQYATLMPQRPTVPGAHWQSLASLGVSLPFTSTPAPPRSPISIPVGPDQVLRLHTRLLCGEAHPSYPGIVISPTSASDSTTSSSDHAIFQSLHEFASPICQVTCSSSSSWRS